MPPQCAFNQKDVVVYTFEHWEKAGGDFDQMRGGYPQPEGTGQVALCGRCNNTVTGDWYVPTYCKWVRTAAGFLDKLPPIREVDREAGKMVSVTLQATLPLALIKEIVAIILTLNGEQDPEFRTKHPELVLFVLNRDRTGLPARYQFYLVLYPGPWARFVPLAGRGKEGQERDVTWLTALDHPPLACVMTVDEKQPLLPLGNVTHFANVPYGEERDVLLEMIVGFGHTPRPGDYRSSAALEADRNRGIKDLVQYVEKPGKES
jgi:hypothetical protein